MRDDAQGFIPPSTSPTPPPTHTADDAAPALGERRLDARLTTAADAIARDLRPMTVGWPADDYGSLVHAAALVGLKAELSRDAYADLQRHYREHRTAFLARLRPPIARAD